MDAPGVDFRGGLIPEWRWANIVQAWRQDTTNTKRLCERNGITIGDLHRELRRRGIDPFQPSQRWVAVPERLR